MSAAFDGAWWVREYVFDPTGALVGTVAQRRRVDRVGADCVRVIQDCDADSALEGHPMARFTGHHEFDVRIDGGVRRYLGPAVIGSGIDHGDGVMTGRGMWPDFGYGFTSFAATIGPDAQLTGGTFYRARETMAVIVGIAERDAGAFPTLAGPYPAPHIEPGEDLLDIRLSPDAGALRASGRAGDRPVVGLAKQYGWLLEVELVDRADAIIECTEVVAPGRNVRVGIRRHLVDHTVQRVDIVRRPEEMQ